MRCKRSAVLGVLAMLGFGPVHSAGAQEIVDGFHGYPWGTKVAAIQELTGVEGSLTSDGLRLYFTDVNLLGASGIAVFYFDAESNELVQGAYNFKLRIATCEAKWEEFESAFVEAYPAMRVDKEKGAPSPVESEVYDTYCEFYVYHADEKIWRTQFVNPATGNVELGMGMGSERLKPELTISYRGDRAINWAATQRARERARLGPTRRAPLPATDTADSTTPLAPGTFRMSAARQDFGGNAWFGFAKGGGYLICFDSDRKGFVFSLTLDTPRPLSPGAYAAGDERAVSGLLLIDTNLALTIDGGSLEVTQADSLTVEAQMDLSVSGMNISSLRKVQTKITGSLSAAFEGSGELGRCQPQ